MRSMVAFAVGRGRSINLCELGMRLLLGPQSDGTYRFHARGRDLGQNCVLGTFADYTVVPTASVIKIDPGVPLHTAALASVGHVCHDVAIRHDAIRKASPWITFRLVESAS
jgi:Zn-dependent alcohol dehydrogenase